MDISQMLKAASKCKAELAALTPKMKNDLLESMADSLIGNADNILTANAADCDRSKDKLSAVMMDRLLLTRERIHDMAAGIRAVAALDDPTGITLERRTLENGLVIEKRSVPLGVIAIIYESRPNVASDAASLCIKSGNVCILRSGSDAILSSTAIVNSLRDGIAAYGLDPNCLCIVESTSHADADRLMQAVGLVDLLIPRGGAQLIRRCVESARVPVIQTGTGICHIYVDAAANTEMALNIIENAKVSRPSVCNAAEVCLVHRKIAKRFLPMLKERLCDMRSQNKVTLITDPTAYAIIGGVPAKNGDFDREFLGYTMAIGVVDSIDDAIAHIAQHSTAHSDAIITDDDNAAAKFTGSVDSAAVYVNASTRFTDGGQFGFGCEMGISTQKLHARGPMGLRELTSYKYVITGNGQIRV